MGQETDGGMMHGDKYHQGVPTDRFPKFRGHYGPSMPEMSTAASGAVSVATVVLRGSPGTKGWVAPGRRVLDRSLGSKVALYLFAAGDAGADVDRFGLMAALVARGASLLAAVLVVPDDLGTRDPAALADIEAWAADHPVETVTGPAPWRVVTLSAFYDPRATVERSPWGFASRAYTGRSPVVGADLGRIFGLCAEYVGRRTGAWAGGWTVWLPGWGHNPDGKGWERRLPNRPCLRLSSRRTGWTVQFGPTVKGRGKRVGGRFWTGDFVDVMSAAYAFDADRGAGYGEHARNLGLAVDELPVAVPVDAGGATAVGEAVSGIRQLAQRIDEAAAGWFTTGADRVRKVRRLDLARLQSPAALADHLLRQTGVSAPLGRFSLSDDEHQRWAEAFHGGWVDDDSRLPAIPFTAATADQSSAYPLVAHYVGWWDVLTAERVSRRTVTAVLREAADRVAADPAAAIPALRRFGFTLAEVDADDDPFLVELDDPHRPDGRSEMARITTRGRTLFVSGLDVLASAALSGSAPRIVRAVRFVAEGKQDGIRATVPVCPGLTVRTDRDPVLGLVRRRREAKATGDGTLGALLHAMTNSLVSGNPSRMDAELRREGDGWALREHAGPWTFLPLAVTVTAGARLLLAVLDRMVADLGGVVAYRDTDSSIIPACPDGGTLTLADGSTVQVLSWADLDRVVATFDELSPEPGWPVWKVVRGTADRPLRSVVFGPKRHAEYVMGPHGPELVEWTESGLGGMWSDTPTMTGRCAEGGQAWSRAAVLREVTHAEAKASNPRRAQRTPAPWDVRGAPRFPTLRRLQVTSPTLLASLPAELGATVGTRYVEGVGDHLFGPSASSVVALDPGGSLDGWRYLRWLDRRTGARVRVSTDPMDTDAVLVESLSARATRYAAPPQNEPVDRVLVTPLSVRYRGHVSGVIDAADTGEPGDLRRLRPIYADRHGLGPGQYDALVALARNLSAADFARRVHTTPRVARRLADGKLPVPATTRRILAALRDADHEAPSCGCGCGFPIPPDRWKYVDETHRQRAKKRRQRAGAVQ